MRIVINTIAECFVYEHWTIEVPDDNEIEAIREEWSDLLDHPEEYGATIIGVANGDTFEEHDRSLHAIFDAAGEEL